MNFISLQFYNIIIEYLLFIYFTFCVLLNKDVIIVEFEFFKICSINSSFFASIPNTDYYSKEIKCQIQ